MQTIIDKSVYLSAKSFYKKLRTGGTLAKKLQAVIAAYQHGIKDTCRIMNVSRTSTRVSHFANKLSSLSI